jgi:serine/threonine-protein kinase
VLGQLYDELALPNEEVRLHRQAVDLTRSLHRANAPEIAAALIELAGAMNGSDDSRSEREAVLREAEAILDRNRDQSSEIRGRLLHKQAEFYQTADLPLALDYARRSVRVLQARSPSEDLVEAWYMQGLIESYSGRPREAAASLNHAVEVSRAVLGVPNPTLTILHYQLAETLGNVPDYAGAERNARLAVQTSLAINGEDHIGTVRTRAQLGNVLLDSGRMREGLELLGSAKQRVLRLRGADDPFHTPAVVYTHGRALARAGNHTEG